MLALSIPGTIESREVAEMIGKEHKNLLRDINLYISYMKEGELKIEPSDFFIGANYQSEQNKSLPCFLVTKKGCEMIANKLTGAKGILFTAAYVTRFNEMQQSQSVLSSCASDRLLRAQAMFMNAQTRQYKVIIKTIVDKRNLTPIAVEVFGLKTIQAVFGTDVGGYLPETERTHSATQVADMYGVTAARVGRLANLHGLKTPEFGIFVLDKSPYSAKEVEAFRYNQRGVERIGQILNT